MSLNLDQLSEVKVVPPGASDSAVKNIVEDLSNKATRSGYTPVIEKVAPSPLPEFDDPKLATKFEALAAAWRGENFMPFIAIGISEPTIEQREAVDLAQAIAWELRVADSEKNATRTKYIETKLEEIDKSQEFSPDKPSIRLYVAYQFLSETFETERDNKIQESGESATLRPPSDEIKDYVLGIIDSRLRETNLELEFSMAGFIKSRANDGATYFIEEIKSRDYNPVRLTPGLSTAEPQA